MKQIVKHLLIISALAAAGTANAGCCWWESLCLSPFIGADFKETWLKGNGDWRRAIAQAYPGGTIYVGTRFCDTWGLELGYTGTGRKERTVTISDREFFGFPNTGNGSENIHTSTRLQSYHLDLNGYFPMECNECWEWIGSIGIASMKAKISTNVVSGVFTPVHQNAFNSIHGKNRAVARLGVGTQYYFCDMIGARAMVRWENTSRLRVAGNDNFNNTMGEISRRPFKDALSLAVGLFFQW